MVDLEDGPRLRGPNVGLLSSTLLCSNLGSLQPMIAGCLDYTKLASNPNCEAVVASHTLGKLQWGVKHMWQPVRISYFD